MSWNVSPERLARLKQSVPGGKIVRVELEPIKGAVLEPLTAQDLGLRPIAAPDRSVEPGAPGRKTA